MLLPRAPALIGGRGMSELTRAVAISFDGPAFDDVVTHMSEVVQAWMEQFKHFHPGIPEETIKETEFYVAGFSLKEQRLISLHMACDDRYLFRDQKPFTLRESEGMTAAPAPSARGGASRWFCLPR
jgi:hypothetical protein